MNAKQNGVKNIAFVNADAGEYLTDMAEERKKTDVIFLDPPRQGATEAFLEAAVRTSPGRIVYISCGPESLLRDLKWLKKHGYKAKEAKAFDLFPFTDHIETVCLLGRRKPDDTIRVRIDMDEYHRIRKEEEEEKSKRS